MFFKVCIKEHLSQNYMMSLLIIYVRKIQPRPGESESLGMKLEICVINKLSSWFLHTTHHCRQIPLRSYLIVGFYYMCEIICRISKSEQNKWKYFSIMHTNHSLCQIVYIFKIISQSVGHDLTCSVLLLGLEILSVEKHQVNRLREESSNNVCGCMHEVFSIFLPSLWLYLHNKIQIHF